MHNDKCTVGFLLGGLSGIGGIGRVTTILANRLVNCEVNVLLYCYSPSSGINQYELDSQIQCKYLTEKPTSMTNSMISGLSRKLHALIVEDGIDYLVACGALYYPLGVLAARRSAAKVVCWEHTNPNVGSDYRLQDQIRSWGAKRSFCNVLISQAALDVYNVRFPEKNNILIYNPIDRKLSDINCRREYNQESKKIISVGRLSYQKNFHAAIEVASLVLETHPEWSWDIYGDGDDRSSLESLIKEKGLENKVCLKGAVSNLYELYGGYSIMVMTSRYEGFPMALIEGLSSRLPLIAFDVETGPNEIITQGENGFLIEAGNIRSMVDKLSCLMDDERLRMAMATRNGEIAEKYSETAIIKRWLSLFYAR